MFFILKKIENISLMISAIFNLFIITLKLIIAVALIILISASFGVSLLSAFAAYDEKEMHKDKKDESWKIFVVITVICCIIFIISLYAEIALISSF